MNGHITLLEVYQPLCHCFIDSRETNFERSSSESLGTTEIMENMNKTL